MLLCSLLIGLHIADNKYAPGDNATIKVVGDIDYYFHGVNFQYRDFVKNIREESEAVCNLGVLKSIEVIAGSTNSLQIDFVDYVRYKDVKNNYEYKSNDRCDGNDANRCCISKDLSDCGNAVQSKSYDLFLYKNCDFDTCDEYVEEELPASDIFCENGIKDEKSQVCCHSSCVDENGNGVCGGSGCSNRGFGAEYCCSGNIKKIQDTCDTIGAPCYNYADKPYVNNDKQDDDKLEWWEILLIIIGSLVFIILIIILATIVVSKKKQVVEDPAEEPNEPKENDLEQQ